MTRIGRVIAWILVLLVAQAGCGDGNTEGDTAHHVGGTLSGLASGSSIALELNGANQTVLTSNGTFAFDAALATGARYDVTIASLPENQPCTSLYASGTVGNSEVTRVTIFCGLPERGSFELTGSLATGRQWHTATLLSSGQVLVVGGYHGPEATAELFTPETGLWSAAGAPAIARTSHTSTRLANGHVVVVGGHDGTNVLDSVERFDPISNLWSVASPVSTPRSSHTAILTFNGTVLVAGGSQNGTSIGNVESYEPSTNQWTATGSLSTPRAGHTATLLPNGKVLVTGGLNGVPLSSAELYDPATRSWAPDLPPVDVPIKSGSPGSRLLDGFRG